MRSALFNLHLCTYFTHLLTHLTCGKQSILKLDLKEQEEEENISKLQWELYLGRRDYLNEDVVLGEINYGHRKTQPWKSGGAEEITNSLFSYSNLIAVQVLLKLGWKPAGKEPTWNSS